MFFITHIIKYFQHTVCHFGNVLKFYSLTSLLTHSEFLLEGNLMTEQLTRIKLGILWDSMSTQLDKNVIYDVFNSLLKDMWKAFINSREQVVYILWFPYLGWLDLKHFVTIKNKNYSVF